jgi:hypothetical protein
MERWVTHNLANMESRVTKNSGNTESRVVENSANRENWVMQDSGKGGGARNWKKEKVLLQEKGQLRSGAQGVLP